MQGVAASLFPFYAGYPDGFPSSTGTNGRLVISSPQVLLTVREFFGCSDLVGAEFEDDGPLGSRNTHWEERIFEVRAWRPSTAQSPMHERLMHERLADRLFLSLFEKQQLIAAWVCLDKGAACIGRGRGRSIPPPGDSYRPHAATVVERLALRSCAACPWLSLPIPQQYSQHRPVATNCLTQARHDAYCPVQERPC